MKKFELEIRVPAFALHTDLPGPETIDITPYLREDILLNLPPYPRCDRDGGRECKGEKFQSTRESRAEEEKREHDWRALDELKMAG